MAHIETILVMDKFRGDPRIKTFNDLLMTISEEKQEETFTLVRDIVKESLIIDKELNGTN